MPIRRRGGLAALKAKKLALEKARRAGESLEEERIEHVEKVVAEFKVPRLSRRGGGLRTDLSFPYSATLCF